MTDQYKGTVLLINDALGGLDIFFEASERLLHDGHMKTILGQDVVDGPPARAIDQRSMDDDNIFRSRLWLRVSHRATDGKHEGNGKLHLQRGHLSLRGCCYVPL